MGATKRPFTVFMQLPNQQRTYYGARLRNRSINMLAGAREAVWTLAFACCVCFCAAGSYNPDATRLVDYFQPSENLTNFIFRGDEPLDDNHTFAYDEMVAAFQERAAAANLTFPSSFYLLDFSLLNIFEFEDINAEKQFFEENPHLGEYYNWVTIGTLLDPMIFPYEIRKEMAERLPEWQFDQLPSLMDKLHSMIQQTYNESLVIYIRIFSSLLHFFVPCLSYLCSPAFAVFQSCL